MTSPPPRLAERTLLLAIVAVALAVRVAALHFASQLPLFTHLRLDNLYYHEAARRIAAGDLLLGREVVHMSPGYTAFLAAIYAVAGEGPWPWRLVQTALGLASVALIARATTTLLRSPRWGLFAAALAALYGPFVFYEQQMLAESLSTFLHAALLSVTLSKMRALDDERPSLRGFIAVGALLGMNALVRPNALVLAAPIVLAIAWTRPLSKPRLRAAGVTLVAAACVIAPVTLRNALVAGEAVLLTDSGGLNFYLGNGPGAEGTFRIPDDVPGSHSAQTQFQAFHAVAERVEGRAMSAREVDRFWYARTLSHALGHPWWWARLLVEKAWLFWNAREIPNNEDYTFQRALNPALGAPLVQFWQLAPLALLGTLSWLLRRRREGALVAGVNVAEMASLVAFFVVARYRLPAVPGLLIAATGLASQIASRWRVRDRRALAITSLALLAALPVVLWPKVPMPLDDEWFKHGFAYHRQGRLTGAEDAYRRALRINPEHLSAHKNLAILRESVGDTTAARREWEAVVRIARASRRTPYVVEANEHLRDLQGR